jgi:hypothetical protein
MSFSNADFKKQYAAEGMSHESTILAHLSKAKSALPTVSYAASTSWDQILAPFLLQHCEGRACRLIFFRRFRIVGFT